MTSTGNAADTMTVFSIMGLTIKPFQTQWRMEAADVVGGDWIVEFSSGRSFDLAYSFADSIRRALNAKAYDEDFTGVQVRCYLDGPRDVYMVVHEGNEIPLSALSFVAV